MASTVWRGNIAFGLVSIPVRLVRAARRERVKFQQVYRPAGGMPPQAESDVVDEEEEAPVSSPVTQRVDSKAALASSSLAKGRTAAAPLEEPPIKPVVAVERPVERVHHAPPPGELLKGFQLEPNQYVTFQREELKAIKPETSSTIEITSFIHLDEVDPIYFDASYYVVPQPAGEKPYSILFGSLQHSGYAAMGRMAMHGREHAAVIRSGTKGLIFETLFYENEVHLADQHPADTSLVTAPEMKMAEAFIKAMAGKFDAAELVDQYEKRLKAFIDQRAAKVSAEAPASKPREAAPVVDIMEALRKSLEQVRKPAKKETQGRRRRAS